MKNYWKKISSLQQWKIVLLLIVLIGSGCFLRLWNLGVPSMWVDEVNSFYAAKAVTEKGDLALPSGYIYTRAPLYSYMTASILKIIGFDEVATRFISVVFGVLSIIMVYILAKNVFNRNVGLLSSFFITFSHFEIGWSRTGRMYTLLQFLTLAILYLFLRAFELEKNKQSLSSFKVKGNSVKGFIKNFWMQMNISPVWLVFTLILIFVSYQYVHFLTVFIICGILMYVFFMALVKLLISSNSTRFINKYIVTSIVTIVTIGIAWIISPGIQQMFNFFLSYTPPWAEGQVTAQKKLFLFEFLISPYRFPLAAFFFIGSLQTFFRFNKKGILIFLSFIIPVLFLSFIFTHRVPVYIFNVYPLFLILASYGFVNLIITEKKYLYEKWKILKGKHPIVREKFINLILVSSFFLMFIISPWIRISFHIPFYGDGNTNMAVTHYEWREAVEIVKNKIQPGDIIISSLPLTSMFYGVNADFTMNWSLLNQSKVLGVKNEKGKWKDNYGGVECIENLNQFKEIMINNNRGWILIEQYHFDSNQYLPGEIRRYIQENFREPLYTKNKTMRIFNWTNNGEN
jgi:4-amino-4-deoxy-L-arabinose transferase-like glycosyltransferase